MDNLEKLISNLSNYWDLSPEKVVDRLNHMNESEIKNVVNKMTKKFKNGGMIDCLREGGTVATCGCGGRTPIKAQEGALLENGPVAGRIPRSSMFDAAREFMPNVDRKFVRQAYRAAKRQGRAAGNTGTYLRQDARDRVIEKFRNYADNSPVNIPVSTSAPQLPVLDDIVIEDEPIVINDNPFGNLDSSVPTVGLMGDFNTVFGQARKRGLSSFSWDDPRAKYERYSTGLATPKEQPLVERVIESGSLNSPTTTGVYPDYYYNNLYNAGVEWGKKWRERRDARKAEKEAKKAAYEAKLAQRYPDGYKPVSLTQAAMEVIPNRRTPR